jgi:hypothetical protein
MMLKDDKRTSLPIKTSPCNVIEERKGDGMMMERWMK